MNYRTQRMIAKFAQMATAVVLSVLIFVGTVTGIEGLADITPKPIETTQINPVDHEDVALKTANILVEIDAAQVDDLYAKHDG